MTPECSCLPGYCQGDDKGKQCRYLVDPKAKQRVDEHATLHEALATGQEPAGFYRPVPGVYSPDQVLHGRHKTQGTLKPDNVNSPPHYTAGGIECIDAIEAALTPEEFRGYCKGCALKYIWRERHKGGDESMQKADWYLNRAVKS